MGSEAKQKSFVVDMSSGVTKIERPHRNQGSNLRQRKEMQEHSFAVSLSQLLLASCSSSFALEFPFHVKMCCSWWSMRSLL